MPVPAREDAWGPMKVSNATYQPLAQNQRRSCTGPRGVSFCSAAIVTSRFRLECRAAGPKATDDSHPCDMAPKP
jgi:hypothetical protein